MFDLGHSTKPSSECARSAALPRPLHRACLFKPPEPPGTQPLRARPPSSTCSCVPACTTTPPSSARRMPMRRQSVASTTATPRGPRDCTRTAPRSRPRRWRSSGSRRWPAPSPPCTWADTDTGVHGTQPTVSTPPPPSQCVFLPLYLSCLRACLPSLYPGHVSRSPMPMLHTCLRTLSSSHTLSPAHACGIRARVPL